jgi:glutathione S-transferase
MKIKLISFALCPYVHRTTTLLHEKGIGFDIEYIDLANKPAWFLEISPRGKVPVLVADGVNLFESAVINEYLDETQPPRMLPDAPLQRAVQRAWIEVVNDLFAAQYKLVYAATQEDFEAAKAACADVIRRFEGAVRGPFFAGETFGLVDAAAAPALHRFSILEAQLPADWSASFPAFSSWMRRVATRPSVVAGVLPDFERSFLAALRKRDGYLARALPPAA